MTTLTFATRQDQQNIDDQLNIGIIRTITSPFNLFLNFEHLIDYKKRYVYFFAYSMGARKVTLWGVFDKKSDNFIVDHGCRYRGSQLYEITNKWSKNGYKYVSNIVVDRITSTIGKYLDVSSWDEDQYKQHKHILRYLRGDLSEDIMEEKYGLDFKYELFPPELDLNDDLAVMEYQSELEIAIKQYELGINRKDYSGFVRGLERPIIKLVETITNKFDIQIQDKKYSEESYEQLLEYCPDIDMCIGQSDGGKCSVWSYGTDGDLYADDIDLM